MADCGSDVSVTSEYLNSSLSSDSEHVKSIKIKVHSPAVTPKLRAHNGHSITHIKTSSQSSPHISRASSSMSLASSSLTSVGVEDVRHLSSNYEQLLHQATASIKKLKKEKGNLEGEQDRLLTVNIELATEVKRLLQLDKKNKTEREVSGVGEQMTSRPCWETTKNCNNKRQSSELSASLRLYQCNWDKRDQIGLQDCKTAEWLLRTQQRKTPRSLVFSALYLSEL